MGRIAILLLVLGGLGVPSAMAGDDTRLSTAIRDDSQGLGPLLDEYRALTALRDQERRQLDRAVTVCTRLRYIAPTGGAGAGDDGELQQTIEALQASIAAGQEDLVRLEKRRAAVATRILTRSADGLPPSHSDTYKAVLIDRLTSVVDAMGEQSESIGRLRRCYLRVGGPLVIDPPLP